MDFSKWVLEMNGLSLNSHKSDASFISFMTGTSVCLGVNYTSPGLSSTYKSTHIKTLLFEIAKIINPNWREHGQYSANFDDYAQGSLFVFTSEGYVRMKNIALEHLLNNYNWESYHEAVGTELLKHMLTSDEIFVFEPFGQSYI